MVAVVTGAASPSGFAGGTGLGAFTTGARWVLRPGRAARGFGRGLVGSTTIAGMLAVWA
jgi:hypothetical protein